MHRVLLKEYEPGQQVAPVKCTYFKNIYETQYIKKKLKELQALTKYCGQHEHYCDNAVRPTSKLR